MLTRDRYLPLYPLPVALAMPGLLLRPAR